MKPPTKLPLTSTSEMTFSINSVPMGEPTKPEILLYAVTLPVTFKFLIVAFFTMENGAT